MKFGAHVSIAGGVFKAPANATEIGCEVFQLFSRSPRGGQAPVLSQEIVARFKQAIKDNNQAEAYIHPPYYINLSSLKNSTTICSKCAATQIQEITAEKQETLDDKAQNPEKIEKKEEPLNLNQHINQYGHDKTQNGFMKK